MSEMMDTLLMEYVDKLDDALENYSDDELDDFVSEMYEVYLEATQRRKKADEIDEWIDKHTKQYVLNQIKAEKDKLAKLEPGTKDYAFLHAKINKLKYSGLKGGFGKEFTPKKKRQLRNFLLQHKFDPKTETIVSDHKDGRRIKFKFGDDNDDNGEYHGDDYKDNNDHIKLDKGNFTDMKNANMTLSHEKGHHMFRRNDTVFQSKQKNDRYIIDPDTGKPKRDEHGNLYKLPNKISKAEYWRSSLYPEDKDERGIKHLDEAKAAGKYVNDHDNGKYLTRDECWEWENGKQSPEELEADLYSAKNARVRTKYAGRKRAVKRSGATRNVNDNEIFRHFKKMADSILDGRIPVEIDNLKLTDMKATGDALIDICNEIINAKIAITSGDAASFSRRYKNYIKARLNDEDTVIPELSKIFKLRKSINKSTSDFMQAGGFGSYPIFNTKECKVIIQQVRTDIDLYMKQLDEIQTYFESESKTVNLLIKYRMHSMDIDKKQLEEAKRFASMIKEIIKKDPTANIGYSEKLKKEVINTHNKLKIEFDKLGKLTDESTGVRYDFVKKYVHEFFEDYYSYDDMEYFTEGFDEMESTVIETNTNDALIQKVATLFDRMHQNQKLQQLAESNGIDVKNTVKLTDDNMMNVAVTLVALSLAKEANDPRYKKLVNTGLQKRSLKMEIINDYKSKANEIINTYKNGI